MSTITSTDPNWLNPLISPVAESPTLSWFGLAESPTSQFWFDVSGLVASAGNTVRKLLAVPLFVVTLPTIPVAGLGIVQLPFLPHTRNVAASPAPIGVWRVPTVSGLTRVSNKRQGTIGTTDEASPVAALSWPATPTSVAVAAASI